MGLCLRKIQLADARSGGTSAKCSNIPGSIRETLASRDLRWRAFLAKVVLRHFPGGIPNSAMNQRVNELNAEYPVSCATIVIDWLELAR